MSVLGYKSGKSQWILIHRLGTNPISFKFTAHSRIEGFWKSIVHITNRVENFPGIYCEWSNYNQWQTQQRKTKNYMDGQPKEVDWKIVRTFDKNSSRQVLRRMVRAC